MQINTVQRTVLITTKGMYDCKILSLSFLYFEGRRRRRRRPSGVGMLLLSVLLLTLLLTERERGGGYYYESIASFCHANRHIKKA